MKRLLVGLPMLAVIAVSWVFPAALDSGPALVIAGVPFYLSGFAIITLAVVATAIVNRRVFPQAKP